MKVKRWQIQDEWRDVLRAEGLDTFFAWHSDPRLHIWRDIAERQNGVIGLPGRLRLHVKLHYAPYGAEAEAEADGIRQLERAGIPTVPLVAWGTLASGEGVLVTGDLAGFRPADKRIAAGEPFDRFAAATADVAVRLHAAGLHHRDLYLCHFLFNDAGEVRLIDAARVRRLPWWGWLTRRRWIVKDLAQFRYSAQQLGVAAAELDGWLAQWARHVGSDAARWRPAVARKAAWIARHDAQLAQQQPERYASLP